MTTSLAISLDFTEPKEKRVLCPFSGAFLFGELRRSQRPKLSASRGILAKD